MIGQSHRLWRMFTATMVAASCFFMAYATFGQDSKNNDNLWQFNLRYRTETAANSNRFSALTREESWVASKTAIIVCDTWDAHHSINAVRRVEEMAPRINEVLNGARPRGATIIHAPSDCMESYVTHPARIRATNVSRAKNIPAGIKNWCSRIAAEKNAIYPIDQSDGGEDDDPEEHQAWANELRNRNRNPSNPWKMESPLIGINPEFDFISDDGEEVWSILESRGIENVILAGVHTNMCVLGRPFGLRNLVAAGKRVVLLRDLTDTMYNPKRWPFVNHHTGTDLVVEYIEKYICPTITSDQLIGGMPFRFKSDTRPLVAILMAEDEYETNRTLPQFAKDYLGNDFRVELLFSSEENPNYIPGLEVLDHADAAIISVRRRPLTKEQMDIVRKFADSGKPMVGIRTASHAFSPRDSITPAGLAAWPEFDAQVWGGNYAGHHGNEQLPTIAVVKENAHHPILSGIQGQTLTSGGSLYKTSPLASTAEILVQGTIPSQPTEPVAWTFKRKNGGKSFYTSLGHKQDFDNPAFARLLFNGLCWAAGIKNDDFPNRDWAQSANAYWKVITIPGDVDGQPAVNPPAPESDVWYRCFVKLESSADKGTIKLQVPNPDGLTVWVNGKPLSMKPEQDKPGSFGLLGELVDAGELNLLVIRQANGRAIQKTMAPPTLIIGKQQHVLSGKWQFRIGNDPSFSQLTLPPKFGAAADIIFD